MGLSAVVATQANILIASDWKVGVAFVAEACNANNNNNVGAPPGSVMALPPNGVNHSAGG